MDHITMAETVKRGLWQVVSPLLSAVIALLGYSFVSGQKAGAIENRVTTLEQRVDRSEREGDIIRAYLQSIDQRTARMEGKLDRR